MECTTCLTDPSTSVSTVFLPSTYPSETVPAPHRVTPARWFHRPGLLDSGVVHILRFPVRHIHYPDFSPNNVLQHSSNVPPSGPAGLHTWSHPTVPLSTSGHATVRLHIRIKLTQERISYRCIFHLGSTAFTIKIMTQSHTITLSPTSVYISNQLIPVH